MKISRYLDSSPAVALNEVAEAVIGGLNRRLSAERVSFLQGLILVALLMEEGPLKPSTLAHGLRTSRANVSHAVSRLEALALVRRSVCKRDARSFEIELRAEGRKLGLRLMKIYDRLQDAFEEELGMQQCARLLSGMHSLRAAYERLFEAESLL